MGQKGGNPNIARGVPKTGPKTDEGRLKQLLLSGFLKKGTMSKVYKKFRRCNKCPIGERIIKKYNPKTKKYVEVSIPAKCSHFEKDGKCVIPAVEHIKKLKIYYEIGEKMDTVALQEYLAYTAIEDAELSKDNEMLKTNQPGFYTHKFKELASNTLSAINKQKYGEKIESKNLNVNISLSESILRAYNKRKNNTFPK